jgi:hypothetical protein
MDRRGWNAPPNIQQLFGCEIWPDGAVLHCKDYMTNADSFWVLAWMAHIISNHEENMNYQHTPTRRVAFTPGILAQVDHSFAAIH